MYTIDYKALPLELAKKSIITGSDYSQLSKAADATLYIESINGTNIYILNTLELTSNIFMYAFGQGPFNLGTSIGAHYFGIIAFVAGTPYFLGLKHYASGGLDYYRLVKRNLLTSTDTNLTAVPYNITTYNLATILKIIPSIYTAYNATEATITLSFQFYYNKTLRESASQSFTTCANLCFASMIEVNTTTGDGFYYWLITLGNYSTNSDVSVELY